MSSEGEKYGRRVTGVAAVLAVGTLLVLAVAVLVWDAAIKEQPGNLVNAVVAAANVAFVIFTWAVFKAAQDQLAHSRVELREQQETNRRQLEYAERTYREAVKARLDQSGPRASVTLADFEINQVRGGRRAKTSKGSVFDGDGVTSLEVATFWQVNNWGADLVLITYADAPGSGRGERLSPGESLSFAFRDSRPVEEWRDLLRARPASWTTRVEVTVANLGQDVRDLHVWEREIRPFELYGEQVRVAEAAAPLGEVVARERSYPVLG